MKPYTTDEVIDRLSAHPGWALNESGKLTRTFTFKNFSGAMLFANAVGHLAEKANHHPDLFIHDYKNVTISVMTHDAGGITDRDFALIGEIDGLV